MVCGLSALVNKMEYDKINKILKELEINKIDSFETSNFFTQQKTAIKNIDDYPTWKNEITHTLSHQRTSINEYSKIERKRIENTKKWFFNFISTKTKCGKTLAPVEYFAMPISFKDMPIKMNTIIESLEGNPYPMYLSSIQGTNQCPILALFDREKRVPQDNYLIRIEESRKVYIKDEKLGLRPALIIEKFEELDYDKMYLDIPDNDSMIEKKYVSKILKESFPTMNIALQAPVLSAPGEIFHEGGISLTYENKSPISQSILDMVQEMSPPQYRTKPMPPRDFNGKILKQNDGIPVHFSEKPYKIRQKIRSVSNKEMGDIEKTFAEKRNFTELSIVGQYEEKGRKMEDFDNLVKVFSKIDINFSSQDAIEFGDEYDTERIMKDANSETMHVNIVKSKHCMSAIPIENQSYFQRMQKLIRETMNGSFEELYRDDEARQRFLNKSIKDSNRKLQNIAATIARSNFRKKISEKDLLDSKGISCDSINSTFTKDITYEYKKEKSNMKINYKKQIILDVLYSESLIFLDIWEYLKNSKEFKTKLELQKMLNELLSSVEIFYDRYTGKYKLMKF